MKYVNKYRKIKNKTKLKTVVILIFLLGISSAPIISLNSNFSETKIHENEVKTSSSITPKYKYHYENNFDLYDYKWDSVLYVAPIGYDTEWSQDPNDSLGLDLWFANYFTGDLNPFSMSASLYVVSHNTFKKQGDSTLGAYIDFHIDIDELLRVDHIEVRSVDLILMILKPDGTEPTQLVNIYNIEQQTGSIEPQTGRFYIPNFDQYIASDGKVRFSLMGLTHGFVPYWWWPWQGGISLLVKFEGLRVVQEIMPKVQVAEKRSLILVHGYSFWGTPDPPTAWNTFSFAPEFLEAYEDIIVINYVDAFYASRISKDANGDWTIYQIIDMNKLISRWHSIGDIAVVLKNYIIIDSDHIEDNVDIICHSMGGLVTRYMIKHLYSEIQWWYYYMLGGRVFKIKNVAMMATPNHGSYVNARIDTQQCEMVAGSDFLNDLNDNPDDPDIPGHDYEIPLAGKDINWFTYRSGLIRALSGLRHDGIVDVYSVPLIGATNKGWYQLGHEELRKNDMMKTVVFNDIIKPPAIIDEIFDEGTPGTIMAIEDLTLEGERLLSITIPSEDVTNIESTSVSIQIGPTTYQMILKDGSTDTYEVELPLAAGDYSFSITANEVFNNIRTGTIYQIYGIVVILPDTSSPVITIESPIDGLITNQDITLTYTVSDDVSDAWNIEIIGPDSGTTYTSERTHDITITATDEAGNSISKSISFTIDKTAPEITILGPTAGYYNTDQIVSWEVSDANLNDVSYSHPSPTTFSTEGTHQVTVSATDLAGNSASKSLTFTIDKTAPVINIYGSTPGYYNVDQTIKWEVSDTNLDDVSYSHPSPKTFSTDGTYQVTVSATDLADNYDSKTLTFTIDKTAPEITILGPTAGYYNTDQAVSWDVSDINLDDVIASHPSRTTFSTEGTYQVTVSASDLAGNIASASSAQFVIDKTKPETSISYGYQHFIINNRVHLTSTTPLELMPEDGSGISKTFYRIYNDTYNSGPIDYSGIFSLALLGLYDGNYVLEYYSTDIAGNIEDPNTELIVLDNSPPELSWEFEGFALQDGFLFDLLAEDATGVTNVMVSIRELNGPNVAEISVMYIGENHWQALQIFETTTLPDGYYELVVIASDNFDLTATKVFRFSIRNWAVLALLPSTPENKAGRTMPVKFALRVVEEVDPNMPFVVNQELDIFITDISTNEVLQHSTFGDSSKDYRINQITEIYITNFKTHKTPKSYAVSIYRKDFFIGDFEFYTVR